MRKTILITITAFIFLSCEEPKKAEVVKYPIYRYGTDTQIPDSMRMAYADWVQKTIAAASNHMTAGDYEDPEDVISQAQETGERIFEVKTDGLYRIINSGSWEEFVPREKLTKGELRILDSLKNLK